VKERISLEEIINIYITEDGFGVDNISEELLADSQVSLYRCYKRNPKEFFYNLAFIDTVINSVSLEFLQHLSKQFLKRVVDSEGINFGMFSDAPLNDEEIAAMIPYVPMIIGHEFINAEWIRQRQTDFDLFLEAEVEKTGKNPLDYLVSKGIDLVVPSRIYFHLVENKDKGEYPFAFLATYTAKNGGKITHFPLKNALSEFKNDTKALDLLISSIRKSSNKSQFVSRYLDSGDIYFPLKMNESDAYDFLREVEIFEKCGIVCRIPKWYTDSKSKVLIDIEEKKLFSGQYLSQNKLNYFSPKLIYKGLEISIDEAKVLLEKREGLEYIKGRWVENNHRELEMLLAEYEQLSGDGTTLLEVLRTKAGINTTEQDIPVCVEFTREDWIQSIIKKCFEDSIEADLPLGFNQILRPYQKDAFSWLWSMFNLGFGVCLADDMGLGKTVEVISFLQKYRVNNSGHALIIVPATLIANWQNELIKFAQDIDIFVLRGTNCPETGKYNAFATITTYQTAMKSEYLNSVYWDIVILDEAQAIKNYYTSQTKKIKSLNAGMKIAMTGTPIENNVLELWSIFDFTNPGLLGSREQFKCLYTSSSDAHKRIKELIQPFVLRRVKTDKSIISDLPEKNEIDITINLTKEQIVLYKKTVSDMNDAIATLKDKRQSQILVFSAVMKLKQICNHPSQYYGLQDYDEKLSGKFVELRNICETIYAKREKVLVFTQFKEIIPALDALLADVFHHHGATIDGDTSMAKRNQYVSHFQKGLYPYMVLSLKTAGVGLNLTAAQNVIHFDRWWNPAVENQATDRAYRIGQKNSVTVYKFVTANTIEEVINSMLKDKQNIADEYINQLDNNVLTKMSTEELLKAVSYGGEEDE
jgi:SNF2 family DNA or RNA helicase